MIYSKPLFKKGSFFGPFFNESFFIKEEGGPFFFILENSEDEIIRPINAVLDPENLFLTDETFDEYMLVVPNIRDCEGFLITPEEYKQKLENISIVMVNVHFKMYIF